MKTAFAVPIVISYVAAVFFEPVAMGPDLVDGILVLTSVLFVWAYLHLVGGRPVVPIVLVAILTIVTPLLVLAWISLPTRHTLGAAFAAVLLYFRDKQALWGLGMAAPTAAAVGVALVMKRMGRPKANSGAPHAL
jgi:hypothetical protein